MVGTGRSASNTGAYNSENDGGDNLLKGYVPDTPGNYERNRLDFAT
jgi:SWI/SNF-related matrix-associated actin-dependent regulator of chromatin subfamily A containing DEAD/H box 1